MTVKVAELFPASDVLARWVFSLSVVVDDLSVADGLLHDAMEDLHDTEVTHHFRSIVTRLYEARRLVLAVDEHEEVRTFLAGITAAQELLATLRDVYVAPSEGCSKIDDEFGVMRHRTVHYSWVGSDELREILDAASDVVARYVVDDTTQTAYFEWPRTVFMRATWGDLSNAANTQRLGDQAQLAHDVTQTFSALLMAVIQPYLQGRGIDGEHLIAALDDEDE